MPNTAVRPHGDVQPETGFLGALSPEDRTLLLARARRMSFADGARIVAEGDPGDAAFVLLSGAAVALQLSPEGRIVTFSDLAPGDLFGELAAIDGGPRSAFVQAKGSATAAAISRAALEQALAASPTLALALMRHLAAMVRLTTARLFEGVMLPVRARLALELMRRGRAASAGDAARLDPAPTHFDLAARIGSHREAITKELSAMARAGLVRKDGRALEIPSLARLAAEIGDAGQAAL
jgi:CRP-like cAMP-binding protein